MQLGFLSAIVPELSLEEVLGLAAEEGFSTVELMCWPRGKAERRYAGVTHIDVTDFTPTQADHVRNLLHIHHVTIAALGYYPNFLDPDPDHRRLTSDHFLKVIRAAEMLGVPVVSTFIGRDWRLPLADNLKLMEAVWPPLIAEAEQRGVRIGIEHCPMLYSHDEWPGGKNLASTPEVWRTLFERFPGTTLGLTFDPSHLIWLGIDCGRALREFGTRIVHVHAKDERIDRERLYQVGIYGFGWHKPKLPGLGDVNWSEFFAALTDCGYSGSVCVEVEDRAYEASLEDRKRALRQSRNFLNQYFGHAG
jgi:sugar phosphate isomerase/epimerase